MKHLCESIERLSSHYGLGYRATTYRGLLIAELRAERIPVITKPSVKLPFRKGTRESQCDCILVDERLAVMTLALQDEITPSDRAVLQTYLRHLSLPFGLAINFGKRGLEARLVWTVSH